MTTILTNHEKYSKIAISIGVLLILTLLFLITLDAGWIQRRFEGEVLIVWGQREGVCLLWLIEPDKPNFYDDPTIGDELCNYMIASVNGTLRLIHVQLLPGVITIYDVNRSKGVSAQQTFSLGNVEITSSPQWDQNGVTYFSAIVDEHEAIYRFITETGNLERFVFQPGGMATDPLLSPDGNHLGYLVLDEISNRHECLLGFSECKGNGDYYVINIVSGEKVALDSLVNLDFSTHVQDLIWSPNGEFLALDLYDGPAPLAILDIQQKVIIDIINNAFGAYGWLSNENLVYQEWDGVTPPKPQIYSLKTKMSYELEDPSLGLNHDMWSAMENLDWTEDGLYLSGTTRNNEGVNQLIIGYLEREVFQMKLTTSQSVYSVTPRWSISGNWIAVPYAKDTIAYLEGTESKIDVLDKNGKKIVSLNLSGVVNPEFDWLSAQ